MIYAELAAQVTHDYGALLEQDFGKAYVKARRSRWISVLTGKNNDLLSFEEVCNLVKPGSQCSEGVRQVRIDRVVGSEGRCQDFNRSFMPVQKHLQNRWESVNRAHYEDKILPSVELYELGGVYFVKDGNHRISVASLRKNKQIDAEVTHLESDIELTPDMTIQDIRLAVEERNTEAASLEPAVSTETAMALAASPAMSAA